jgi:hypothetical protein
MALGVAGVLTLCLVALGVGHAAPQGAGQAAAEQTPMSDKYFKNVQLLRGIPVDEFMDTMGMFAAATGMNCVDCHVAESDGNPTNNGRSQTWYRMGTYSASAIHLSPTGFSSSLTGLLRR